MAMTAAANHQRAQNKPLDFSSGLLLLHKLAALQSARGHQYAVVA